MGRALLLQNMPFAAATYQRWWGQVGLGPEYQGAPVGGVRAKPSTLQPTPTAGSLKMVPRLLRTLTTATQPRESTQGGRPQAYARDTPPAPPGGTLLGVFTSLWQRGSA